MYTDVQKKRWPLVLAAVIALCLIFVLAGWFAKTSDRSMAEEGEKAIGEAVRKCALQCYVVEGVYPPDLEYLEEHYGLQVNKKDYYVTYDAFASNLPPDVRVTKRD